MKARGVDTVAATGFPMEGLKGITMSAHCCEHDTPKPETILNVARYRKILWVALVVNAGMFLVEIGAGLQAGSLSLLADAVDFAGDALNYGVSLAVDRKS